MAKNEKNEIDVGGAYNKFREDKWDVRMFGGVHPQFRGGHERTAGAVQVSPALSVFAPEIVEHGLTRTAGAGEGSDDGGLTANMGRKEYVRYGVYRFTATYQPKRGEQNAVKKEDLVAFWDGLLHGWADARSSNRTGVNLREVVVFVFPSTRGSSEVRLRESVEVAAAPTATRWSDVRVEVDHDAADEVGATVYRWQDGRINEFRPREENGRFVGSYEALPSDPGMRWLAVGLIEVVASNPNGDPDNAGAPRVFSDGTGVISYESIKRVIRDYVASERKLGLFIERQSNLTEIQRTYLEPSSSK